ncbi:MAG: hypothetical protein Q9195_003243 [Heterodermia aff. obscurata]
MDAFLARDIILDQKVLLGVGGIFLAIVTYFMSRRTEKLVGIPVMTGFGNDYEEAMMVGTEKVNETTSSRPFVMLPTNCYEEVKNLPQDKATFWEIQKKEMGAEFTGIFQHNAEVAVSLKMDLNRNLGSTLEAVEDKIDWVLNKELGQPEDWKAFRVHEFTVLTVARLVAGVFVAPRFIKDDEWTKLSLGLAVDLVRARDAIKNWPTFMQPIVGPFLSDIRVVNRHISKMAEKLKPVISNYLLNSPATTTPLYREKRKIVTNGMSEDEEGEEGGSFMSWMIKRLDSTDPLVLARAQVSLSFASINTTTNALTFIVLDLATRPEYIQPLRDEVEEVAREDNVEEDENGILRFKQTSLAKLWKLDSFIKESSRLSKNPITTLRQVMQPMTLSTGHRLPKGTRFAFPARAVQMSRRSQAFSPEYNPAENKGPQEFDGFRFYRLRKMAGKQNRHLFVTVSQESLTWGYGNHACPGRFFADSELKVILIELLRKWDMRVADPTKTNSVVLRKLRGLFVVVPKDAEVEMRRRKL